MVLTTVSVAAFPATTVESAGGWTAAAGLRDRLPARRDRDRLVRGFSPFPPSTIAVDRVVAESATSAGSPTAPEPWGEFVGTLAAAAVPLVAPAFKGAPAGAPRLRRTPFRRGRSVAFSDGSIPGSFVMMSIAIALPNAGSGD